MKSAYNVGSVYGEKKCKLMGSFGEKRDFFLEKLWFGEKKDFNHEYEARENGKKLIM